MSAALVLAELRAAGASLTVEPGGLRVRAPRRLPPELLARARALKPALLELLTSPPPAAPAELPPEALGLDPDDPIALVASAADPEPPSPPAAGWGLLPPSAIPFHLRPKVLADAARCLGCGARALAGGQCRRCRCLAPIAGPTLEPPGGLPEPGALDGADQGDVAGFPNIAPGPCPACGAVTIATAGLGFCEGCGWARLPPVEALQGHRTAENGAPAPRGAPLPAAVESVAMRSAPPAQGILAAVEAPQAPNFSPAPSSEPGLAPAPRAPARQKLPEEKEKRSFGSFSPLVPPQSGRASSTEAPPEPSSGPSAHPVPPRSRRSPPAPAPRAPMANPLDAPPRRPAIEIVTKEKPEAPVCLPPVEPPAVRAARFGYAIAPDGSYIEAHQAHAPRRPPFLPRFDARWRPSDEPAAEAERQQQRAAAAAYCRSVLGPRR